MPHDATNPLLPRFLATADAVADARPEVDREMAREVLHEAATLLHDGLALDGLDPHDTATVVDGLCAALVDADPGAAVRGRAETATSDPAGLNDPDAVAAAYLTAAGILQL